MALTSLAQQRYWHDRRARHTQQRGKDANDRSIGHRQALADRRLVKRYQYYGDIGARDELVRQFMPLAQQLARRYQRANEPLDDLVQVASIGLIKAVERYDPDRGTALSSYAVPTILGELKRYFRDNSWSLHVPRGMQERVMQVNSATESLSSQLGRTPTAGEVADTIDETTENVLEAMEAASAYDSVSLESSRGGDDSEGEAYADQIGSEDERYALVEQTATIGPELKALPRRERLVLGLRFVEDMTQSQIAEHIGVSQMHVSRLIQRALNRVRAAHKPDSHRHRAR
jgi:RNA polymerase sigma-B factor